MTGQITTPSASPIELVGEFIGGPVPDVPPTHVKNEFGNTEFHLSLTDGVLRLDLTSLQGFRPHIASRAAECLTPYTLDLRPRVAINGRQDRRGEMQSLGQGVLWSVMAHHLRALATHPGEPIYAHEIELPQELKEKHGLNFLGDSRRNIMRLLHDAYSAELDHRSDVIGRVFDRPAHRAIRKRVDTMFRPYEPSSGGITSAMILGHRLRSIKARS